MLQAAALLLAVSVPGFHYLNTGSYYVLIIECVDDDTGEVSFNVSGHGRDGFSWRRPLSSGFICFDIDCTDPMGVTLDRESGVVRVRQQGADISYYNHRGFPTDGIIDRARIEYTKCCWIVRTKSHGGIVRCHLREAHDRSKE